MMDDLKALSKLGPMFATAREMQSRMKEIQARIPSLRATAQSGGGLVTATAGGSMEIISIVYAEGAPFADHELLADLTRAAVNQALKNVQSMAQQEMEKVTGGMDMGAIQGMFGQ